MGAEDLEPRFNSETYPQGIINIIDKSNPDLWQVDCGDGIAWYWSVGEPIDENVSDLTTEELLNYIIDKEYYKGYISVSSYEYFIDTLRWKYRAVDELVLRDDVLETVYIYYNELMNSLYENLEAINDTGLLTAYDEDQDQAVIDYADDLKLLEHILKQEDQRDFLEAFIIWYENDILQNFDLTTISTYSTHKDYTCWTKSFWEAYMEASQMRSIYVIDEPYDYPIKPYSEEWYSEDCIHFNIPEELLPQLTTKALVETEIKNDLAYSWASHDIKFFESFSIEKRDHYNVLDELLNRPDLTEALFEVYKDTPPVSVLPLADRTDEAYVDLWDDIVETQKTTRLEELMVIDQLLHGEYTPEEKFSILPYIQHYNDYRTQNYEGFLLTSSFLTYYTKETGLFAFDTKTIIKTYISQIYIPYSMSLITFLIS